MRVLVCGDRRMSNAELMHSTLSKIDITHLIEGEARGADTLAREYALAHNIPVQRFPANWTQYGRAAGSIRNKEMLDVGKPELVIAFLAPESKGTRNMIDQALRYGVRTEVIHIP